MKERAEFRMDGVGKEEIQREEGAKEWAGGKGMNEWRVCLRVGGRRGEWETLKEVIHWLFLCLVKEEVYCHG